MFLAVQKTAECFILQKWWNFFVIKVVNKAVTLQSDSRITKSRRVIVTLIQNFAKFTLNI